MPPTAEPAGSLLFRPVADFYGLRVALVFGNQAPEGMCPFAVESLCHHCDIGLGEGIAFDSEANLRRLSWYEAHFQREWNSVAHLVLYNSGSLLNPKEMPANVLGEILAFAARKASIKVVSLDSRESFVNQRRLAAVTDCLRDDQCARIIIGVETADDRIRDEILKKRMPRESIEAAFDSLAFCADRIGQHRIGVDVNILVGGPGTTEKSAVADALATARFALEKARTSVDLNVHPYYPSRRGIARFPSHPRCPAKILLDALRAIAEICKSRPSHACIFLGWHDEGHDTQQPCREVEDLRYSPLIARFNRSQDVTDLQ